MRKGSSNSHCAPLNCVLQEDTAMLQLFSGRRWLDRKLYPGQDGSPARKREFGELRDHCRSRAAVREAVRLQSKLLRRQPRHATFTRNHNKFLLSFHRCCTFFLKLCRYGEFIFHANFNYLRFWQSYDVPIRLFIKRKCQLPSFFFVHGTVISIFRQTDSIWD